MSKRDTRLWAAFQPAAAIPQTARALCDLSPWNNDGCVRTLIKTRFPRRQCLKKAGRRFTPRLTMRWKNGFYSLPLTRSLSLYYSPSFSECDYSFLSYGFKTWLVFSSSAVISTCCAINAYLCHQVCPKNLKGAWRSNLCPYNFFFSLIKFLFLWNYGEKRSTK